MTAAGWTVFLVAVLGMTSLLIWCVFKVVSTPGSEDHLHSPADIDTHDT